MSDSAIKIISIAVIVLASCIILTFGFRMARNMNNTSDEVVTQSNDTITDMEMAQYTTYDDKIVSGDDVMLAIDRYQTRMWIKVYLNSLSSETVPFRYFPATNYEIENEYGSKSYIDPTSSYESTLMFDENGVLEGIKFEEI